MERGGIVEERSISSLQHPLVKHLVKLRADSTYRYEHQSLVLEGLKPIQEMSSSLIKLFYTADYASQAFNFSGEKWQITESILRKISGMTAPEGIIAVIRMPSFVELGKAKHVLALDGINDPGNMGTLLRTALALGWESVYFLPGCCDPFNEKVMRAARGAHFKLLLAKGSVDELKKWVRTENVQPLVADLEGKEPEHFSAAPKRLLVLGNEAHGASPAISKFCQPVTIPMSGKMESLNVAVAGGILLYLLRGMQNNHLEATL